MQKGLDTSKESPQRDDSKITVLTVDTTLLVQRSSSASYGRRLPRFRQLGNASLHPEPATDDLESAHQQTRELGRGKCQRELGLVLLESVKEGFFAHDFTLLYGLCEEHRINFDVLTSERTDCSDLRQS